MSRPSADSRCLRPPSRPRGGKPGLGTLAQQVSFHLSEHGTDLQHGLAHDRGGIDPFLEGAQADALALELLPQIDKLVGRSAKPVETSDDERVAAAKMRESGGKAGLIGARTRGAVLRKGRSFQPRLLSCRKLCLAARLTVCSIVTELVQLMRVCGSVGATEPADSQMTKTSSQLSRNVRMKVQGSSVIGLGQT